jgi:hypothetical protein
MIGKKPRAVEGGSGFQGLVAYIEQAKKADFVFMGGVSSLDAAVAEMRAVSEMNPSVRDPVYHFILSWPRHERPTRDQVNEAVAMQMEALGLEEHQYVAATHHDSDNYHVHIAVNRVHPRTFRACNPRGDFFTIDKTCREIELRQGWSHDRGPYCVEYIGTQPLIIEQRYRHLFRQLSDGAKKIERYTGEISLERWARDSDKLAEIFSKSASWNDVHKKLRIIGLELIQSSDQNGLVLRNPENSAHAKASLVEGYSLAGLMDRLGDFQGDASGTEHEIESILKDMTKMRATFTERDLDGYVSSFVDIDRMDIVKRAIMASPECIHLVADEKGMPRFTTAAVVAEEKRALVAADRLAARPARKATDAAVRSAMKSRTMRPDQIEVFQRTLKGGRLAICQGRAGVGKSYMMSALREAYEASGCRVIGLGPTNAIAAAELADGFKVTMTVDKAIIDARKGLLRWDADTVLIVDESSMVSNEKMAEFLEITHGVGKVIFIGDDRQLPAVERGGLFKHFGSDARFDCGEIRIVTRQKEERQRLAAEFFSQNRWEDGMAIYHEEGRIHWEGTDDESRDALLAAWKADFATDGTESRFVITYKNDDVDFFNRAIHDHLILVKNITHPKTLETRHGKFEFAVGESIMFTATDRKLKISNGTKGTISGWSDGGMVVRLDTGTVTIPLSGRNKFDGFRLGHAGTTYKVQGGSISRTYLHHTRQWRDAAGYVALTRATRSATVFASKESATDWRDIARQMRTTMLKSCASAYGRAAERHLPSPVKAVLAGDGAKLVALIGSEVKARKAVESAGENSGPVNMTSEWRNERLRTTSSLKGRLFERFLTERKGADESGQTAWVEALAAAKRNRDEEIRTLRAAHASAAAGIRNEAPDNLAMSAMLAVNATEMKAALADVRGRHRRIIADIVGRKPSAVDFEGWIAARATAGDADARKHQDWRQSAHDRQSDRHIGRLVDLCRVLADAGWQQDRKDRIDGKDRNETQRWKHPDGRFLTVLIDADGSGVRWVDTESRQGGGLEALLHVLYSDSRELYRRYLTEAKNLTDRSPHQESDRFDHRTYDVVAARRDWESGADLGERMSTMIGSIPVTDLIHELGARAADARLVRRPGGAAILAANRDQEGNIVGYELISATYRTAVRGSCLGFGFAIAAAARIDIGRRRQEETPDIKRKIAQLITLEAADLLTLPEAIGMASIRAAKAGSEFLARHPRTWTAKEARAIASLEAVSANAEVVWEQAAAARRAELETADIVAAGRTIREADISDERLRAMNPVERRDFVSGIDSAARIFSDFHRRISERVQSPDEISMLSGIVSVLARLKTNWIEIVTSDQQRAVYDIVAKNLGNSKIMEGLLGRTGTIYARQCAEEIMNYPFQVPLRIPHVDKAEAVIKAIDQHQAQPIATTATAKPAHVKSRVHAWTPPIP